VQELSPCVNADDAIIDVLLRILFHFPRFGCQSAVKVNHWLLPEPSLSMIIIWRPFRLSHPACGSKILARRKGIHSFPSSSQSPNAPLLMRESRESISIVMLDSLQQTPKHSVPMISTRAGTSINVSPEDADAALAIRQTYEPGSNHTDESCF
jgi:hypothetical protein